MAPDITAMVREAEVQEQLARIAPDPYSDRQDVERIAAQDAALRASELRHRITAAEAQRRDDLAAIHTEAKRRGLPQDVYRGKVRLACGGTLEPDGSVTGGRTDSSADLTASERQALLLDLRSDKRGRGPKPAALDRQAMLRKVEAMLAAERLPWSYAEAILRRQRGISDKSVACPISSATDPELRGVIAALYRRSKPPAATAPRAGVPAIPGHKGH